MKRIEKRRTTNLLLLAIPIVGIFCLSLFLTLQWKFGSPVNSDEWTKHLIAFSPLYIVWLFSYYGFRIFDLWAFKKFIKFVPKLLIASGINFTIAVLYFYFQPDLILTPRRFLLVHILLLVLSILLWYGIVRLVVKKNLQTQLYFLELESEFQQMKREHETSDRIETSLKGNIQQRNLDKFVHSKKDWRSVQLILPPNLTLGQSESTLLSLIHQKGAVFKKFESFYEETYRRVYLSNLNENWLLINMEQKMNSIYTVMKRTTDIISGIIIGIVFIVLCPIVIPLIKLTGSGTVFFTQKRIATNGKEFVIYKYRTMSMGTKNDIWTSDDDPRITRFGKFLRKTRIDELPQFINLLTGDMSLVGPRPEQVGIVNTLKTEIPFYDTRHAIRPGITGWAQLHVYASTTAQTKKKLQYDLYYLKHRSLLFDLEIMFKTIFHILFMEGK